jgi:hypothetical protein
MQKIPKLIPVSIFTEENVKPIPDLMVIAGICVCYPCLEEIGG